MKRLVTLGCLVMFPTGSVAGTTLTATATGSESPAIAMCSDTDKTAGVSKTVSNGDFAIVQVCTGHPENRAAGDGFNEDTRWTFDLTKDPHWQANKTNCQIDSALVEIRFVATDQTAGPTGTDFLRVEGAWDFGLPDIQNSGPGEKRRLRFEMLNHRGYLQHLDRLVFQDHAGKLPMHYSDDAIVHGATLTVQCK